MYVHIETFGLTNNYNAANKKNSIRIELPSREANFRYIAKRC